MRSRGLQWLTALVDQVELPYSWANTKSAIPFPRSCFESLWVLDKDESWWPGLSNRTSAPEVVRDLASQTCGSILHALDGGRPSGESGGQQHRQQIENHSVPLWRGPVTSDVQQESE
ncbi:hypothetical protein NDU88_003902 [Pleurodeles waltl]|uniref:Uncharacterized protein n=1 Tax=Pleurodeles waltl TaxID=8319 RepID=A0AAV7SHC8_PLEWA|nr:hypothetical protein NDU88_003902 [Pleurodeles waltl]